MKTLLIVGLLIGMYGLANATWYENNPDHCASIGFNLSGASGSGTQKLSSGGLSAEQDFDSAALGIFADTRIPLSESVSLNAGIGLSGAGTEAPETPVFDKIESSEGAFHFNVGIRFYLGKRDHPVHAQAKSDWVEPKSKEMSNEELVEEMKSRGLIPK